MAKFQTNPNSILGAVLITVVFWFFFTVLGFAGLESRYRSEHRVPSVRHELFGTTWYTKGSVSVSNILDAYSCPALWLALFAYPVLHVVFGWVVAQCFECLMTAVSTVFNLEAKERLTPDQRILVGAGWPVTILAIPLLLIAVLIGGLFRLLE